MNLPKEITDKICYLYNKDNFYLKEGEITWKGEKIQ